jgi:hypothetical protein
MGGDGSSSTASGPSGYVWRSAGRASGRLYRSAWPFAEAEPAPVPRAQRPWPARVLPERFARFLRGLGGDRAWVLQAEGVGPQEERVVLAAMVFAIELSHW